MTDDTLFCVCIADDEATVQEHAKAGGFPCNAVRHVGTIISDDGRGGLKPPPAHGHALCP